MDQTVPDCVRVRQNTAIPAVELPDDVRKAMAAQAEAEGVDPKVILRRVMRQALDEPCTYPPPFNRRSGHRWVLIALLLTFLSAFTRLSYAHGFTAVVARVDA